MPRVTGFLAMALASVSVVAAAARQAPTFRSTTHLVRVDTVVTDATGAPVTGLTADDFTLLDNGAPRAITTFEEIRHPLGSAMPVGHRDVATNQADGTGQLLVLVLDDFHIRKEWSDHARTIVENFVRDLSDDTLIAVLSSSGKYNVEVTSDRQRVIDMLEGFTGHENHLAFGTGSDHLWTIQPPPASPGLTPEEAARYRVTKPNPPNPLHESVVGGCHHTALTGSPLDSFALFKLLESASKILGADESRHRALAWISTGESFAREGFDYAIDTMRQSGVATYAIDPVGTARVIPGGVYEDGCKTAWQVVADHKHESLTDTARASGGEAVINDDDFGAGVRKIVTDFGSYYVLGFRPEDTTTPGDRPLTVGVTRRGLMVRARRSYSLDEAVPRPAAEAMNTAAGGLVPKGDLPLRLYAGALPNGANGGRVFVMLEVTAPNAPSDAKQGDPPDRLPYAVRAVDLSSGKVVQQLSNEATVALVPGTTRHAFALRTGLALPPGRYQLRASAASTRTGEAGSVFLSLDVPDFRGPSLALSDLLVGDAHEPTADTTSGAAAAILRSLPIAPTLARSFAAGSAIHVYAEVATKSRTALADATIAFVAADGTTAWTRMHALTGTGDRRVLDAAITVPSLTPGDYALRISVASGAATAHRDVGIKIR